MAIDVIMPVLGMAQESGRLVRWLKQPGEPVARGELLFEVETDKAVQEIEATAAGVLGPWLVAEGEEVPVTQVVARLYAPGEMVANLEGGAAKSAAPVTAAPPVAASPVAARVAAVHNVDLALARTEGGPVQKADVLAYRAGEQVSQEKVLASPKARRLAFESNVALSALRGSGLGGAIVTHDVVARQATSAAAAPVVPELRAEPLTVLERDDVHEQPMSTAWHIMAERTTQAWTSAPHFFLQRKALADRLHAWQRSAQPRWEDKITVSDMLIMVCAQALTEHPQVNRSWREGRILTQTAVHIGLAVALEDGLVVPVIRNADHLSLREIARTRAGLVERAYTGRLRVDDLAGGTFTISNLGMFGVERFLAILNPPQAAILAVGKLHDQVLPIDGQLAIRLVLELSVTFDHRVVDGARGARFLQTLVTLIEDPIQLLESHR